MQKNLFFIIVVTAIFCLAMGGIFVKLSALPPINTGFWRVAFSLPLLFPFVRKELRNLAKKDILLMLLAGAFLAGDLALWNVSFSYTTVANANLLSNLTPLVVIPVCFFIFKERVPPRFLLGAFIALAGVVVLVSGKVSPSPENFKGDLLAFATAFFYASFLLCVYKLRTHISALAIMFVSAFGSLVVLAAAGVAVEGFAVPRTFDELYPLLALAVCSQILGQGGLAFALGKISANLASLLCLTQPIMAALVAFLLFKEVLSGFEMLGVAITIAGIYIAKRA